MSVVTVILSPCAAACLLSSYDGMNKVTLASLLSEREARALSNGDAQLCDINCNKPLDRLNHTVKRLNTTIRLGVRELCTN